VDVAAAGGRRCECEARNASTLGSPRSCMDSQEKVRSGFA
jgi:hypothetical protein